MVLYVNFIMMNIIIKILLNIKERDLRSRICKHFEFLLIEQGILKEKSRLHLRQTPCLKDKSMKEHNTINWKSNNEGAMPNLLGIGNQYSEVQ